MSIASWIRRHSLVPRVSNVYKYTYMQTESSKCYYCLERATEMDHVLPVSVAELLPYFKFPSELLQLVPCCRKCNAIAGNKFFISIASKKAHILARLSELELRAEYEAALSKLEEILRKY